MIGRLRYGLIIIPFLLLTESVGAHHIALGSDFFYWADGPSPYDWREIREECSIGGSCHDLGLVNGTMMYSINYACVYEWWIDSAGNGCHADAFMYSRMALHQANYAETLEMRGRVWLSVGNLMSEVCWAFKDRPEERMWRMFVSSMEYNSSSPAWPVQVRFYHIPVGCVGGEYGWKLGVRLYWIGDSVSCPDQCEKYQTLFWSEDNIPMNTWAVYSVQVYDYAGIGYGTVSVVTYAGLRSFTFTTRFSTTTDYVNLYLNYRHNEQMWTDYAWLDHAMGSGGCGPEPGPEHGSLDGQIGAC